MLDGVLIWVIAAGLLFGFINGFHDASNAIATSVYTKALSVRKMILLAAVMNFAGALATEKVAMTISEDIIRCPLEQYVILGALMGTICWNLVTWWRGLPSSSTHALIGSLLGATMVYTLSVKEIYWDSVMTNVVIPIFTSPVVGFILAFLLMKAIFVIFADRPYNKTNKLFLKLQLISAAFVAFSHGHNDGQKSMGVITLALISGGAIGTGEGVPWWVSLTCAAAIALGTSFGGWRIMSTMGNGVTRLEPAGGFAAQTASAMAIEAMTFMGMPISTTQVITSAIFGVGGANRASSVKWGLAGNIIFTWLVTLPAAMVSGGAFVGIIVMFI